MRIGTAFLVTLSALPFAIIFSFSIESYSDLRMSHVISRRVYAPESGSVVARKARFIKEAISNISSGDLSAGQISRLNPGDVAREMNRLEPKYGLPYSWGGSIQNSNFGFDCSGLVHGIHYYLGLNTFNRRLNTRDLYWELTRSRDSIVVFDASRDGSEIPSDRILEVGDIILWPSSVSDGRNIPGLIWGHVGIVSSQNGNQAEVTHYVSSPDYNLIDLVGVPGPGINTLPAQDFMRLKKRGRLAIFRNQPRAN